MTVVRTKTQQHKKELLEIIRQLSSARDIRFLLRCARYVKGATKPKASRACVRVNPKGFRNTPFSGLDINEQTLERFVTNFYWKQQLNWPTLVKKVDKTKIRQSMITLAKLMKIDGYSFTKEIKPALTWAVDDEFWSGNVLSLVRIRSKSKRNGESKFTNIVSSWYRATHKRRGAKREGGVNIGSQSERILAD